MFKVHIELHGMQAFLFSVPRLRSMIGANVLLGETVRCRMREKAKSGCVSLAGDEYKEIAQLHPEHDPDDPLSSSEGVDDPRALFLEGILARDGGHFAAVFKSKDEIARFQKEIEPLIASELPGVTIDWKITDLSKPPKENQVDLSKIPQRGIELVHLPWFQVCQETGHDPAVEVITYPREEIRFVSQTAAKTHHKGDAFFRNQGKDIISLLKDQLPLKDLQAPVTVQDLCAGGYLAVIHADGNGVGKRFKDWQKRCEKEINDRFANEPMVKQNLAREAYGERFYHGMRVAVRQAVIEALKSTFHEYEGKYQPYQLLMLGGDDLLMICQAKYALAFIVDYARALSTRPLADGQPLTIGAGVVISKPNLPFHRLQDVADELASSAKQRFRNSAVPASVVDWMVVTQSETESPEAARRRDQWICYKVNDQIEELALSVRPCLVLGEQPDSLEFLLKKAEALRAGIGKTKEEDPLGKQGRAARSQLRYLASILNQGRRFADLAWLDLPDATRETLAEALGIPPNGPDGVGSLWQRVPESGNRWKTSLADLVELYEISALGGKGDNGHDQ
ncbi:MAG TPA: hypothetical protein PK878_19395 [bacterium]|nr:hypothetical protein [bacterium]HOL96000.1 hypothetical protein [bacterium]